MNNNIQKKIILFIITLVLILITGILFAAQNKDQIEGKMVQQEVSTAFIDLHEKKKLSAIIAFICGAVIVWFTEHFLYECLCTKFKLFLNNRKYRSEYRAFDQELTHDKKKLEKVQLQRAILKARQGKRVGVVELTNLVPNSSVDIDGKLLKELLAVANKFSHNSTQFKQMLSIICKSLT